MESAGGSKMDEGKLDELQRSVMKLEIGDRRELAMQLIWSLPRDDVVLINKGLSQTLRKDIIASLPAEIGHIILARLKLEDILNCTLVSRTWASRCQDQALWSRMCIAHDPPIVPAQTTFAQLEMHRQLMHAHIIPVTESLANFVSDEAPDDTLASDPLFAQGGMGGGGGIDPVAAEPPSARRTGWALQSNPFRSMVAYTKGLRHDVWERNGSSAGSTTPSAGSSSSARKTDPDFAYGCFQPYRPQPIRPPHTPISSDFIDTHSPEDRLPPIAPRVNYKHLYIVHAKLKRRIRDPTVLIPSPYPHAEGRRVPLIKPLSLDAMASVTNGGLPGHLENIYTLDMFRHEMEIATDAASAGFVSLETLSGPKRLMEPKIKGRDWLLSGSRDESMRLWVLDGRPRCVKVFTGGHTGSVLRVSTVKAKWARRDLRVETAPVSEGGGSGPQAVDEGDRTRSTEDHLGDTEVPREKVWAVTGGSDGCICLWDVEGNHGDKPDKMIRAHSDSVLCVRANAHKVVSCSKELPMKVFSLPDLVETLAIYPLDQRGAVNDLGISDKYIADKTLRVWCIETGEELVRLVPHTRGIASVAFDPYPHPDFVGRARAPGGIVLGTVATGSSDASVKIFNLVQYASAPGKTVVEGLDPDEASRGLRINGNDDDDDDYEDGTDEGDASSVDVDSGRGGDEGRSVPGPKLYLEKQRTCYSACICPPALARVSGKRCRRCLNRGHMELVRSVSINRGVVLSGSYDGTVKVWDRLEGRALADLSGSRTGRVFSVVGDRLRVVTAGMDCRIMIWEFGQGLDTAFVEP